jgi:hypothetical protein
VMITTTLANVIKYKGQVAKLATAADFDY